jgi:hypothetical protein
MAIKKSKRKKAASKKAASKKAASKKAASKKAASKKAASKKAARKPRPPKLVADVVDGLVLVLASGATQTAATEYAVQNAGLAPILAAAHVEEATRRILLAASFDRMEELGTAYTRLNMLFTRANSQHDYKSALSAQRELNKLLSLYRTPDDGPDTEEPPSADLAAVRQHLEPLDLAPPDTPVEELARIAALAIMGADL